MLTWENCYEGVPARLYRSPDEIRRDIGRITKQIRETDEMLSVRNIIIEMLGGCAISDPHKWIPELRETVEEAEKSLEALRKLRESLSYLEEELEETLCVMGR